MTGLGVGSEFAGYRIEGVAGQGGMGVVYRATQLDLDRLVALKLITPEYAADEDFRERFVRESRTAASIEHPNVIPVYGTGEFEGALFIAMRYVEGTDLRAQLKQHVRIDPDRTSNLLGQVAAALDAAHARGLVHRDVKPANVLVADGDHVYLTDFGLTKRSESSSALTKTGQFVGTYDYVAPEQIEAKRVDARTDVYALGCMTYHVLSGEVPYDRPTDMAKLWAHVNDPPPRLTSDLAEFQPVVDRGMAKDPDDRYQSAGDLGRALAAIAAGRIPSSAERSVARGQAAPDSQPLADASTTIDSVAPAVAPHPAGRPTLPEEEDKQEERNRRTLVIVAGALVLVGVIAAIALGGGGGGGDDKGGGGGSSGTTDVKPLDGTAVTITPVTISSPGGITDGPNGLWVSNYKKATVTPIDSSSKLGKPIRVGDGPTAMAAGPEGDVWVATENGVIVRIDGNRGEVVGTPVEIASSSYGDSMVVAGKYLWAVNVNEGTLTRIQRETLDSKTIKTPRGTAGELAFGAGSLWVPGDDSTVAELDPVTGAPKGEPIKVGRKPTKEEGGFRAEIAASDDAVWIAALDQEVVLQIAPTSHKKGPKVKLGEAGVEGDIVLGPDGSLYVNQDNGQTVRVDPKTNKIAGQPLPAPPKGAGNGIAYFQDALWLASSADDNTVTRIGR